MPLPITRRPLPSGPGGCRPPGKRLTAYEHFPHTNGIPYDFLAYNHNLLRFFVDEHSSLRTFSCAIFIPYDVLAYYLFPIRSFSFANICHHEHHIVRTLSHAIFRHTSICLRTFVMRILFIRSFVRTTLIPSILLHLRHSGGGEPSHFGENRLKLCVSLGRNAELTSLKHMMPDRKPSHSGDLTLARMQFRQGLP